eukprot:2274174-Prymnesium_polylepis.3
MEPQPNPQRGVGPIAMDRLTGGDTGSISPRRGPIVDATALTALDDAKAGQRAMPTKATGRKAGRTLRVELGKREWAVHETCRDLIRRLRPTCTRHLRLSPRTRQDTSTTLIHPSGMRSSKSSKGHVRRSHDWPEEPRVRDIANSAEPTQHAAHKVMEGPRVAKGIPERTPKREMGCIRATLRIGIS